MEQIKERTLKEENGCLIISGINTFSLADTLDCGQAFRWVPTEDGYWQGVVGDRIAEITFTDGSLIIKNSSISDYDALWRDYFDLSRDYSSIVSSVSCDPILKKATALCPGIRVLRQEPWETLCSFIISQNNNIKRIKGIIQRLCQTFGKEIVPGIFSFPSAQTVAALSLEDLAPLRAGFRAKYILDAARNVASKEVDLDKIYSMTTEEGRTELMKICGVGEKVADCTLLFGFGKIDAFPKDVWIKRAMTSLFPEGLPECAIPWAGIVQQYIFHYARTVGI